MAATSVLSFPDLEGSWWPSRYGEGDEAGALNEITPAKVIEAVGLVRTGVVHDLAHVLHENIPALPGRTFRPHLTTNAHQAHRRRHDPRHAGCGRKHVHRPVAQLTPTQPLATPLDAPTHLP